MKRLFSVLLVALSLNGCGAEWFPEDSNTSATAPTNFTFTPKTGVIAGQVVTSNTVTLTGFQNPLTVSVSGADSTYSVNGTEFTSTPSTILPNQSLQVKHTATNAPSAVTTTVVTVGSYTTTFSSTTLPSTAP